MRAPLEPRPPEAARRWVVRLAFAFYLALLAEGVLRKWVLPNASNALVFLRDPIMVALLVAYARMGVAPRTRLVLACTGGALLGLTLCTACQAATTAVPSLVLAAGLRNYVLFVPLSFAIGDAFSPRDYRNWVVLNLALALPLAALVAAQYAAPPTAAINAVPGGGNDGVFLVVEDVVRPYGPFSFALGQSAYAAWMVGLAFAVATGGPALRIPRPAGAVASAAIVVSGVLSGSRTFFLLAASVVLCFGLVAVLAGSVRAKLQAMAATAAALLAGGSTLLVLPGVAANLLERQSEAVANEGSTIDRLGDVLGGFVGAASRVPTFGYGLGSGTNIAAFLANGRTDHILAEYELTRIVEELGPWFGGGYILLRWSFLAWLIGLTLRAAVRGNMQPACFIGFVAPVFLAHDITLQNTMIGIGWFAAGIVIAAARVGCAEAVRSPSRPLPRSGLSGAAA